MARVVSRKGVLEFYAAGEDKPFSTIPVYEWIESQVVGHHRPGYRKELEELTKDGNEFIS